jgi:hypothetical protein
MSIENIGVGTAANDGTGDSIRDAFIKTNNNFSYFDSLTKNLTTGNLTASGNIQLDFTANSYWTGNVFLNGIRVATVGTTFTGGTVDGTSGPTDFQLLLDSTNTTTGAVLVKGGIGVAGNAFIGNTTTYNLSAVGTVGTTALNSVTGIFTGAVNTGPLLVTGNASTSGNLTAGNVTAFSTNDTRRNVASYFGFFQEVTGTLQTVAQPNITSVGTLTGLASTGAVNITNNTQSTSTGTGALVISGGVGVSGNIYVAASAGNSVIASGNVETLSNALVRGNVFASSIIAGIGTFSNATVTEFPSNFHVPNKGYVNSLVVAFAIGLGS